MPRSSRRLVPLGALALAAAIAEACSLAIPFDDYRAQGRDAGTDATIGVVADAAVDDGGDGAASCGADLQSDRLNCGLCGRVCADSKACENGRCPIETLVAEDAGTIGELLIAVNGSEPNSLYYSLSTGGLGRIGLLDAGAPRHLISALVVDSFDINNAGKRGVAASSGGVYGFDPDQVSAPAVLYSSRPGVDAVRVYGSPSSFYWSEQAGIGAVPVSAPDGGAVVSATRSVAGFASPAGALLWATSNGDVWAILGGAPPSKILASGADGLTQLEGNADNLYLLQANKAVLIYPWDAARVVNPKATVVPIAKPLAMTTGPNHLWVIDAEGGGPNVAELQRYPAGGGAKTVLASGFNPSGSVVVKDPYIYFADGPRILRTTK